MFGIFSFSKPRAGLVAALLMAVSTPLSAAPLSWTDWADLALSSSVVLSGEISDVDRFSRREAPDVPPGEVRAMVQVALRSALRAPVVLPEAAAWIWQGAADQRGRPPFARGERVFVFANLLSGGSRPEVQALTLVAKDGQQPWTEEADTIVRAILTEARQPGVRDLTVIGIEDGFRSEGEVPGASISQYFLQTANGAPLVMVVRRRAGQQLPEILASTGELIDQAEPVRPQTLAWRALACGLPDLLPDRLAGNLGLADDYLIARLRIGDCGRTRAAGLSNAAE